MRHGRAGVRAGAALKGDAVPLSTHCLEPGSWQLLQGLQRAPRSEIPLLPGEEKGQNIFQRTAANVNDKIMNLKLGPSAPEAGLGSPFSWCKMVNTLRVKDISQLVPNYSPLKC